MLFHIFTCTSCDSTFKSCVQKFYHSMIMSVRHMFEITCFLVGSVTTFITCMINSCVVLSFMDTLLVFVTYWKHFPTLTTKVWNHNFFCNSVMNLAAGEHSSTLVFGSLVTTVTGVKIKVSKLTVIVMPSIIQVYFDCLSNNCSSTCFTSSLSTSMFFVNVV